MVLGRNVEHDLMTCRIQEWQLCLSYFWGYLPLLYLTVIMHWFCVRSVSWIPFGIFLWYLVEMYNKMKWHVAYKNDNFGFLTFGVTSLYCHTCNIGVPWPVRLSVRLFVNNWLVSATPPTVFGQSFWNFTDVLAMVCRCAYCLLIILRFFFFFSNFFRFVYLVSFYLKPL